VARWPAGRRATHHRIGPRGWGGAPRGAGARVVAVAAGLGVPPTLELGALGLVLTYALAPVLAQGVARRAWLAALVLPVGAAALYFGWHAAFGALVGHPVAPPGVALRAGIVAGGFTLGFAIQIALHAWPHGRLANALRPHLVGGLYLDELLTRFTFYLWPPRLAARDDGARALLPAAPEISR